MFTLSRSIKWCLGVSFISLFMVILLSPSVFADWNSFVEKGYYEGSRTFIYKMKSYSNGIYGWNNTGIVNFTGYHAVFNFSKLEIYKDSWWSSWASQNVYFLWEFKSGSETLGFEIPLRRHLEWWGLQDKLCTGLVNFWYNPDGVCLDCNSWDCFVGGSLVAGDLGEYFSFGENFLFDVIKVNDTCIRAVLQIEKAGTNLGLVDYNFTVASGFCDSVTIRFYIKHIVGCGSGEFSGWFDDVIYTNDAYNPNINYETNEAETFAELIAKYIKGIGNSLAVLPESIKALFSNADVWFSWLFVVLDVVWVGVSSALPFLPFILVFWLLDAIGTSLYYGDLHPIGNCIMVMYEFARGVIQTIVNVAETVWDAITFWS